MVKFINAHTGCEFYVDENRVDEYKAMGHKLATVAKEPTKEPAKKGKAKK
jgi:hypothetical protein